MPGEGTTPEQPGLTEETPVTRSPGPRRVREEPIDAHYAAAAVLEDRSRGGGYSDQTSAMNSSGRSSTSLPASWFVITTGGSVAGKGRSGITVIRRGNLLGEFATAAASRT